LRKVLAWLFVVCLVYVDEIGWNLSPDSRPYKGFTMAIFVLHLDCKFEMDACDKVVGYPVSSTAHRWERDIYPDVKVSVEKGRHVRVTSSAAAAHLFKGGELVQDSIYSGL